MHLLSIMGILNIHASFQGCRIKPPASVYRNEKLPRKSHTLLELHQLKAMKPKKTGNQPILHESWSDQTFTILTKSISTFAWSKKKKIYIYMGMALKTLWIVPRWSGRLERGGYVKGHDPEVSKAQIKDPVFMIWHHMSTWVCGLTRGHMERRRDLFQPAQL